MSVGILIGLVIGVYIGWFVGLQKPYCGKCVDAHKALDAYGVARGKFGHSVRYRIGLLAEELKP